MAGIVGPIGRQRRLGYLEHLDGWMSEAFTRILGAVKMQEVKDISASEANGLAGGSHTYTGRMLLISTSDNVRGADMLS